MKITDVKTVMLTGPSTNDPFLAEARKFRSAAFIEIYTDTEYIGIGETYAGYFLPEAVPSIVDFFKPILIGQNVDDVNELWRRMYHSGNFWCRVGLGLSVLNGIEAALWDLKGKLENKPVYEILNGLQHNRLLAYATGGPSNYPFDKLSSKIEHYLNLGFKAFKLGAGSFSVENGFLLETSPEAAAEFEVKKMEYIRSVVGNEVGVMLDGHMGNAPTGIWNLETATAVLKALEPYNLLFFEEPLHYTDINGYSQLCKNTTIQVAGGECLTGVTEWQKFIDMNCFDIGQPDASFTGGLTTVIEVADLLAKQNRKIATHSWGAGGSLMQNIHAAFACENTTIVEIPPDYGPLHSEIIGDSLEMKNGYVFPPAKPGLGIELNRKTKEKFPFIPGTGEFNDVPGKNLAEVEKELSR